MSDFTVHASAEVSPQARIGAGSKIWHEAQVREGAVIGKNCVIGKGVYIDTEVRIGNRVKIQNGVSIYKGAELEDEVFIGPNATFTNDLRPRSFDNRWQIAKTLLKRGASVGANATIVCGLTLGEFSMISAGSVLTVDALPYGLYVGNPARLKNFISRAGHEMQLRRSELGFWEYFCSETEERLSIRFDVHVGSDD